MLCFWVNTNINKVLAYLKQVNIIIARVKSQFFQVGHKIVGYSCDIDGAYLDIFKVRKIHNRPECMDIILASIFIVVYVYYQI